MKLAISAVLLSIAMAAPLTGQAAPAPGAAAPPPPLGMHPRGPHGPGMFGPGMSAHRVQAITNSPLTAQFTETENYTNREGANTQQSATSMVYRDAQGRVREEITLPAPPPRNAAASQPGVASKAPAAPHGPRTIVTILDPVAHTITHLNAERQTAYVQTVPVDFFTHMQQRDDRRETGQAQHNRHNATTTSLGSKVFAGVSATGEQTTMTFPARDGGAAHTLTHQTWFSPDLKIQVSSSESSDRGNRTDTLTSVNRTEPDPSLFQVPADYTNTDMPEHHFGGRRHGGPGAPGDGVDSEGAPPPPPPPPSM